MRRGLCWFASLVCALSAMEAVGASPTTQVAKGVWTRSGQWQQDELGRVRIVHGVNIVRKFAPYYEDRLGTDDASFLASEGFTAVRLGFIWEAVEPEPGVYDDQYVQRIVAHDALLAGYGIRTLVDFHQDRWARPFGGDGAPAWATPPNNVKAKVGNAAVVAASDSFAAFWRNDPAIDGIGVQTHFINAWKHVVPFLKNSSNVIGLDLLNEPYPGSDYGNPDNSGGIHAPCAWGGDCPDFERGALSDLYARLIAAIRPLDAKHTLYVEPISGGDHEIVLRNLADANLGLSYHEYCALLSISWLPSEFVDPIEEKQCPAEEIAGLDFGLRYVKDNGVSTVLSEFSAAKTTPDDARMVDLMGQRLLSWTRWSYYNGPKIPLETVLTPNILSSDYFPASQANARQETLDAIVVPYPAATAGTPVEYAFDRSTSTMRYTYSSVPPSASLNANASTLVFVPKRKFPKGYSVEVSGAHVVSRPNAAYLELVTDAGASTIQLTIKPGSSGSTAYPTADELARL